MCRPVIESMRERNFGRIINISSVNGQKGQMGQSNYSASKAGDLGFTKALAQENASKGITVNAICPGYIATEMVMAVPPDVLEKSIISQTSGAPPRPAGRGGSVRRVPGLRRRRFHHRLYLVGQRRNDNDLTRCGCRSQFLAGFGLTCRLLTRKVALRAPGSQKRCRVRPQQEPAGRDSAIPRRNPSMQTLRNALEQSEKNGAAIGHFNVADWFC